MDFIKHIKKIKIPEFKNGVIIQCNFNITYFNDNLFRQYEIPLPKHIQGACKKRRAEYLAGRYCARKALSIKSIQCDEIKTGSQREPLWPHGVSGSISHASNTAVSAVGLISDYPHVGIDCEDLIAEEKIPDIQSMILQKNELESLSPHPLNKSELFSLIFSAKESLFKALYPYVQCYFDFQDAKFISIDSKQQNFTIKITKSLTYKYPAGTCFTGYFNFISNHILTMVYQ